MYLNNNSLKKKVRLLLYKAASLSVVSDGEKDSG